MQVTIHIIYNIITHRRIPYITDFNNANDIVSNVTRGDFENTDIIDGYYYYIYYCYLYLYLYLSILYLSILYFDIGNYCDFVNRLYFYI